MKKAGENEAIKVYIMPERHGWSYRVDPPVSLQGRQKELPFYGEHGFWLKTEGELLLWLEKVAKLKLQARAE